MFALFWLILLPFRLAFLLLRILHGVSLFISCVVPVIIAAAIVGWLVWYVFVR